MSCSRDCEQGGGGRKMSTACPMALRTARARHMKEIEAIDANEGDVMSRPKIRVKSPARWLKRPAALVALGFVLLFTQSGQGQAPPPLKFFTNVFITGGYGVAGINLRGIGGKNGSPANIATGTISINSSVPIN